MQTIAKFRFPIETLGNDRRVENVKTATKKSNIVILR